MENTKEILIDKALNLVDKIHPRLVDEIRKELLEIDTKTKSVHFYRKHIINRFKYKYLGYNFLCERGWNDIEIIEIFNNNQDIVKLLNQCLDKYVYLTNERRQEVYESLIYIKDINDIKYTKRAISVLVTKEIFGDVHTTIFSEKYYTCLGLSEDQAKEIVSKIQKENANKFLTKRKNNPENYDDCNTTQLKYWLKKGYSEDEAKIKLKERQSTFSLEKCIARYGEIEGREVFNRRQEKWQNSLVNKPNYAEICKSRGMSYQDYVIKYGEERAKEIMNAKMFNFTKASKESLLVFIPLYKWLRKNNIIEKKEIFLGVSGSKEFYLRDNDVICFFDFTIPTHHIIIEFNGIVFHPKTRDQEDFIHAYSTKTKEELFDSYERKKELARNKDFSLLVIWSDETVENNLNMCKDFILGDLNNENW